MNIRSQKMKFRLSVLKFALANGVANAVNKYHLNRQFIYRLKWRYGGTAESLLPKISRLHHHPNEHTEKEIALIKDMRTKYPFNGLNQNKIFDGT